MSKTTQPSSSLLRRILGPKEVAYDSNGFWDRVEDGDLKEQMEIFFQIEREQGVHSFEATDEKELAERLAEDEYFASIYRFGELLSALEWCHHDLSQMHQDELEDVQLILKSAPNRVADAQLNFSSFFPALLQEAEKGAQHFLPLVEQKAHEHARPMGR